MNHRWHTMWIQTMTTTTRKFERKTKTTHTHIKGNSVYIFVYNVLLIQHQFGSIKYCVDRVLSLSLFLYVWWLLSINQFFWFRLVEMMKRPINHIYIGLHHLWTYKGFFYIFFFYKKNRWLSRNHLRYIPDNVFIKNFGLHLM